MKSAAAVTKVPQAQSSKTEELDYTPPPTLKKAVRSVSASSPDSENKSLPMAFRMYTDDEVAEMLQVSLSQLRKWRMRRNQAKRHGPPFKKLGRLVRYPGQSLHAY